MLIQKTFTIFLIGFLLIGNTFAQQKTDFIPKKIEVPAELKQKALGFLRETMKEIPNLKTAENRQYFLLEMANLLWKYDQKEASPIFESAMKDVRQRLIELKAESSKVETKLKESGVYAGNSMSNMSNSASNTYTGIRKDEEFYRETAALSQKYQPVMMLRRAIIENLGEAEPQTTYRFLVETEKLFPEFLKDRPEFYSYRDTSLKSRIILNLAGKDIDAAIEIVRGTLSDGVDDQTFEILNTIYNTNPDKGSLFAEEVLQKIPTIKFENGKFTTLRKFLDIAVESKTQTGKKPLLSEKSFGVLVNLFADSALSDKNSSYSYYANRYEKLIEKYAPEKAAKLRLKFKKRGGSNSNYNTYTNSLYATNTVANISTVNTRVSNSRITNKAERDAIKAEELIQQKARLEREQKEAEQKILLQKLQDGKFTPEERVKAIEQIKKDVLAETSYGYGGFNIFGGSGDAFNRATKIRKLAFFAGLSADKEIAEKLMDEAASLARPQTKSVADYLSNMSLATGYSAFHPEKSFAILEKTILPFNDVISGGMKVGEFLDDENFLIVNNELMISFLFSGPGNPFSGGSDNPFGDRRFFVNLAQADFTRTKSLTDKFERPEFRMIARLLILNALLGEDPEVSRNPSGIDID